MPGDRIHAAGAAAPAMRIEQCPPVEVLCVVGAPLIRPHGGQLDPVHVFLQDHGEGRGRLVVECWGRAWACWWGGMGSSLRTFIRAADAGYIANCLVRGNRDAVTSHRQQERDEIYVLAIAQAVKHAVQVTEPAHA